MPCQRSPSLESLSTQANDEDMIQDYLWQERCLQEQASLQELSLSNPSFDDASARLVFKHPHGNDAMEIPAPRKLRVAIPRGHYSVYVLLVWEAPGEARCSVTCGSISIDLKNQPSSDSIKLCNKSGITLCVEAKNGEEKVEVQSNRERLLGSGVLRIRAGAEYFDMLLN